MKKLIICIASLVLYLFAGAPIKAANASKVTNLYVISEVENLNLGKNIDKVWTLSYSEQELPITISLQHSSHGKEYVVRSRFFEVMYASDKAGFGVRKMNNSLKQVPDKINARVLDQEEMARQQVIQSKVLSDEDALDLIASFLPELLNEEYNHLLY